MPEPRPQTLEQIKTLVRRDLKLGADAVIPDDMPFFGGDIDLDSLDILLLMTSIEKHFKIKVPSEVVGKQIFQNVSTLAAYVDQSTGGGAQADAGPGVAVTPVDYLARLPHGPVFRFITRVTQIVEGKTGEAVWSLRGDEPFFAGHFPGNPIVPGVLIAEALAQLSGIVGADASIRDGMLAQVDVRFERPVVPPAEVVLRSKLLGGLGDLQQFEVSASVGEARVAGGTLTLYRGPAKS